MRFKKTGDGLLFFLRGEGMNDEDKLFNFAKTVGKIAAKLLFKKLVLPYLPVIGFVAAVFFILLMFIGVIYSAVPQTGTVTGDVTQSDQDREIIAADKKIADQYNIANTWLVSDQEIQPDQPDIKPPTGGWYDKLVGTNMKSLRDHYGNDEQQIYTWGFVNALETFYAMAKDTLVNATDADMLANVLKPYFYYEKSVIVTTTCGKDGCNTTVQHIFLLLESNTWKGHCIYHYKWVTKVTSGKDWTSTQQYEVLDHVETISTWERFDKALVDVYNIYGNAVDSLSLARESIIQAAFGMDNIEMTDNPSINNGNLAWLLEKSVSDAAMFLAGPAPQVTAQDIIYQPIKDIGAVKDYLQSFNSALVTDPSYLQILDQIGQQCNMNPLFLVAVTGAEQSFVPTTKSNWTKVIKNPFNVTGGNGPGSWETYQPGFAVSANIAARTLAKDSLGCPEGWNVVYWIEGIQPDGSMRPHTNDYIGAYAQDASGTNRTWIYNVSTIYAKLKEIAGE